MMFFMPSLGLGPGILIVLLEFFLLFSESVVLYSHPNTSNCQHSVFLSGSFLTFILSLRRITTQILQSVDLYYRTLAFLQMLSVPSSRRPSGTYRLTIFYLIIIRYSANSIYALKIYMWPFFKWILVIFHYVLQWKLCCRISYQGRFTESGTNLWFLKYLRKDFIPLYTFIIRLLSDCSVGASVNDYWCLKLVCVPMSRAAETLVLVRVFIECVIG